MIQPQSGTQLALFYDTLDSETRIVVQQRTTEIKALMKRAASDIIEIGQKLIEVRARLGHGFFDGWVKAEFDWTRQTAYRFIHVAERFGDCSNLLQMAPSALYLLAAPSTPEAARIEAIDRAEQGETISHAAAREIVANHRQPQIVVYDEPPPLTVPNIIVPRTEENGDLIDDGIDDVLDPPMEPAQVTDLFAAPHHTHERRAHIMRVMGSSESPEWYTPRHIIDRVVAVFGEIDLDPCSNSRETPNVPALNHYTAADDGLTQPWRGRVYMNPPYGDEIPQWVDRLVQAYEGEEINAAIALLPARVDTNWFQPLWDYALCFVKGRLRFSGAENSAPFPSVVVYLGPDVELFREQFGDIGRCGVLL